MRKFILTTGSRDHTNRALIKNAMLAYGPAIFIEGGARGADRLVAQVCYELCWPFLRWHANWKQLNKAAGGYRNQAMVDFAARVGCKTCLAFPLPGSVGTWDCVRKAKAADLKVEVKEP